MPTTAGLGGLNSVYIDLESVYGTYQSPVAATGVWVPILDENLKYTETKYYSPQIREQTIASDVKQSFYHVEGDIHMEVDTLLQRLDPHRVFTPIRQFLVTLVVHIRLVLQRVFLLPQFVMLSDLVMLAV